MNYPAYLEFDDDVTSDSLSRRQSKDGFGLPFALHSM